MTVQVNGKNVDQLIVASNRALLDTANLFVSLVKNTIKEAEGSDTWEMIDSIFVKKRGEDYVVWSDAVQAIIMEFGRKPLSKRPPTSSLVPWANRKGIVSWNTIDDLTNDERGIIYAMAKSIGENWIKPRKYFTNTYEKYKDDLALFYKKAFISYIR